MYISTKLDKNVFFSSAYDTLRVLLKSFPRGFVQMFPAHGVLDLNVSYN